MTGTARLWPVCPASNVPYDNYGSKTVKDAGNRAPCPVCCKVVKLRKVSGHGPWPNTIPHHHAQPNEAMLARMRENEQFQAERDAADDRYEDPSAIFGDPRA